MRDYWLVQKLAIAPLTLAFALGCHSSAFAQENRTCDYLEPATVIRLLGRPAKPNPPHGQNDLSDGTQSHRCTWTTSYPSVAPGAPANAATVEIILLRFQSVAAMNATMLRPEELGPKVKVEKIAALGDDGSFTINSDLKVALVTAGKGTKMFVVSVDMGLNPLHQNIKSELLTVAAQLLKRL